MNRLSLITLCVLLGSSACAIPAQGLFVQTLPPGLETVEGNSSLPVPFTSGSDNKWQYAFDSSMFAVQAPIIIRDIQIRADGGQALTGFDFTAVGLTMASATANYNSLSTTNLASNLASNLNNWRFPQPFVFASVPGNPCGASPKFKILQGGFQVYDPRLGADLIIEVTSCGANTPWNAPIDAHTGAMAQRYGDPGNCAANASTTSDGTVPVFFIEFATSEEWETNEPGAQLTLNGVNNTAVTRLQVNSCVGLLNVLLAESALAGNAWEMAVTPGPGSPASVKGFRSTSGQIINIDLSLPTTFLNNLTFPPFPGTFALPITIPAPVVTAAQLLVVDPANPDGSELSALCQINVLGVTTPPNPSVMGPSADDASFTVDIGCFPFFGTVYTQVHVSTNGRAVFGAPDSTPAPLNPSDICQDNAFIGYWADLDASQAGASIVASDGGNRLVRISYNNIPYAGENPAVVNNFSIELDGATGKLTLEGLPGVVAHPQTSANSPNGLLGISAGLGQLTNPGSNPFTLGVGFFPGAGRDAIYEFGTAGTLAPGAQRIIFQPIKSGALANNYFWTVQ